MYHSSRPPKWQLLTLPTKKGEHIQRTFAGRFMATSKENCNVVM